MADSMGSKIQGGVKDINQELKEEDIAQKAKEMGLSYVNLITVPVNPDLARVISKEESEEAGAVVFFKAGKRIRLAVVNPMQAKAQALILNLKGQGNEVNINLCSEESLKSGQRIYFTPQYQKHREKIENVVDENDLSSFADAIKDLESLQKQIEASPYDLALNYIQVGAYKAHASDVHFQPEEESVLVRFRVDGILKPVFYLSRRIYNGLTKQIKQLSHLKLNITKIPQDGQYSFSINQRQINVRVSLLPTQYGETCVMRLLDPNKAFQAFEALGFEGQSLEHIEQVIHLPQGLILVTGPTGSGKTTTMYSMLQSIDTKAKKVITLEDPIEYHLAGITQSQVDHDNNYSFNSGLRAILRQDPNVIMVGEIRDLETAETAAQASLTGHLVMSTLHTNSAVEALARLVNMGVKSFILAPAIDLIMAQRLVRKVCLSCGQPRVLTEGEKNQVQPIVQSIKEKGVNIPQKIEVKEAPGCEQCVNTGFSGQLAISEVLRFTPQLRDLILENTPLPEIYDYIEKELKMLSLKEDGVLKVLNGLTTFSEVWRVVGE